METRTSLSDVWYHILVGFVKLLSHLPFRVLYILSDMMYYPLYHLLRYRRKIVRKNLTESFPDKSPAEIRQMERRFYHFFMDMMLESCKLISISPEEIGRRITFANIDKVNATLAEGRSIAAYLGHYGNWEWVSSTGLWLYKGAVSAQIYHKLNNKHIDKLVRGLRERLGNLCVDMHNTVRFMANAASADKPYIIGFVADQSPKRRESKYYIDFLNHRVPVLTGTEKAIKHYGYAAVFISMRRVRRGYYECAFIPLHDDPASLPDYQLTDLYFSRLEEEIRRQPEYYLWTHNRFKYAEKSDSQAPNNTL